MNTQTADSSVKLQRASECPVEKVAEALGDRVVLLPHFGLNKAIHFDNQLEFVKHTVERLQGSYACIIPWDCFDEISDYLSGKFPEVQHVFNKTESE